MERQYRVIIAGSRSLENKRADVIIELDKMHLDATLVISGTCRGPDKFGETWAQLHGIPIKRMSADWGRLGKSAGHYRNLAMSKLADFAIIFWDGESRGSKDMIDICVERELPHVVVEMKP